MKRFIILIFFASLLFAVKPVPRTKKANNDKGSVVKTEKITEYKKQNSYENKAKTKKDYFKDTDSNGVNDQREDDLQKIKQLKTKHKDLLIKNSSGKKEKINKTSTQKSSKSTKKRTK
ncbi:MAG: hypothetical protein V3T09_04065 [bacterium]